MRALSITLLLSALLLAACSPDVPSVTVRDLHARYEAGQPVVLDVRTAAELEGELGHLDDVINIPVQMLPDKSDELDFFREDTVYVICRTGNRSSSATALLRDRGFHAFNVEGGMTAWRKSFGDSDR
jgi:rhodanese-related sulfurtransferase